MENNQQQKGERNTSTNEDNSFINQHPGQQLPAKNEAAIKTNANEVQSKERHSESSKPETENETLGTP